MDEPESQEQQLPNPDFGNAHVWLGRYDLRQAQAVPVGPNDRRPAARARAFQNVPLYKAIFENYKGGVLPPAAALERDIIGLGVAEKQTGRARQVFEKSAEQAGYFEHGKTRLVMPAVAAREDAPPPPPPPAEEQANRERKGNGGGGDIGDHDPLILGLFQNCQSLNRIGPQRTASNGFKRRRISLILSIRAKVAS